VKIRNQQLVSLLDTINNSGKGKVWFAGQGIAPAWSMKICSLQPQRGGTRYRSHSEVSQSGKMPSVCWWLIFALVLPFGYNVMTKWRFAMKTFSLSSTPARPQRLWQVAGLNNADGVALLGQINEGLDGKVANRITDWARITQNDLKNVDNPVNHI
jgi:hypothetical protein